MGNSQNKGKAITKLAAKQADSSQHLFHSLQDAMEITLKLAPNSQVPLIVSTLCNKVRELNGFDTEGIFRIAAPRKELEHYKAKLAANDYAVDTQDAHVAAGLLKDWLRSLKEPLIPQTHYEIAVQMAKKNELSQEAMEGFVSQLPDVNRATIRYLAEFLRELTDEKHAVKSKMTIKNVCIVFGPLFLRSSNQDPMAILQNSKHEIDFLMALIQELGSKKHVHTTASGGDEEWKTEPAVPSAPGLEEDAAPPPYAVVEPGLENEHDVDGEGEEGYDEGHDVDAVRAWFDENFKGQLSTQDIDKYYGVFMENGFVDLGIISEINSNDLEKMNIVMLAHQKRILKAISNLTSQ